MFPKEADETLLSNRTGGSFAFGVTHDKVWVFLPADQTLVFASKDGQKTELLKVCLPNWQGKAGEPLVSPIFMQGTLLWLDVFVAQVGFPLKSGFHTSLYAWHPKTATWKELKQLDLDALRALLAGTDQGRLTFVRGATPGSAVWEIAQISIP